MAAELGQTAESICSSTTKVIGANRGSPTEAYIQKLDGSTGASLKLTVLNPEGCVWTLVADGGASVVYSDAIAAHGFSDELPNCGEYSGAPIEGQTYKYAKTIVDLITRGSPKPNGKILIIGGGIANFTNVASTFKGIIRALKDVTIFVRRGGPNYQEGLKAMRLLGKSLGVPVKVYGPDTHIIEIVPIALGIKSARKSGVSSARSIPQSAPGSPPPGKVIGGAPSDEASIGAIHSSGERMQPGDQIVHFPDGKKGSVRPWFRPFDAKTRSLVYGLQPRAIQGMLDFDYSCGHDTPSVSACFSSQIKTVTIIAEGVPERHAREILHLAKEKDILIAGYFKIDNSGGMMDNIIASKLYLAGSVGYISKLGGMSNELNNILSLVMNGTYKGIAIGGDRYPGSTFIVYLLRYEADPDCKMLILLGEVGGIEEYRVIDAVKSGKIRKPIVAWAICTCAKMFATEVQFGHAGSVANSLMETSDAKNAAMKAAGIVVSETFEDLSDVLRETYNVLVASGAVFPKPEREPPVIPMDYKWAQELGLIRKPAVFISTISDERGQELLYAGMRITDVFKEDIGLGGVVSSLWFKRSLMAPRPPSTSGLKCVHLCGCLFRRYAQCLLFYSIS
ncbi:succinyl-CoA synthetase-like protein [Phellopilus nigrolimitatus]|nr:succinyl-CoA synthetase-like protein [Phellopilus nigrolimitatus]